jgi:hypothetical protein
VVAEPRRGYRVADVSAPFRHAERRRELERAVAHAVATAHRLGVGATELLDELRRQLSTGPV